METFWRRFQGVLSSGAVIKDIFAVFSGSLSSRMAAIETFSP